MCRLSFSPTISEIVPPLSVAYLSPCWGGIRFRSVCVSEIVPPVNVAYLSHCWGGISWWDCTIIIMWRSGANDFYIKTISNIYEIYTSRTSVAANELDITAISLPQRPNRATTHCWRTCSHSWPYQQTKRFWPYLMIQPTQSTTWVDWVSERSYKAQQGMTQGP